MKITHKGKITTQILSVVLCVLVLAMLACTMCPFFTITEVYNPVTKPDPKTDHFSLTDIIWLRTQEVIEYFTDGLHMSFPINMFVTNIVLSFIFALGTLATTIWHSANEYRRFPSITAGVFTHICGLACGILGVMGLNNNYLLITYANPKFAFIRQVMLILCIVIAVVALARCVVWTLTEIKLYKEKKARLALL